MQLLDNKNILIYGDPKQPDLMKGLVDQLQAQGATLFLMGVHQDELGSAFSDCHFIYTDFFNSETIKKDLKLIVNEFGNIDAFVNVVSFSSENNLYDSSDSDLVECFQGTSSHLVLLSKAIKCFLKKSDNGSLVNIMPSCGQLFAPSLYRFVKNNMISVVRSLAQDLATDNIRVNNISPGFIASEHSDKKMSLYTFDDVVQRIPMRRAGTITDVVNTCIYLVSDLSLYGTGMDLKIDGGLKTSF